jgi:endonuclease YncB( thermonuclease family)
MRMLRNACLAVMAMLCALSSHAADKKQWSQMAACRYVIDANNDGDSFLVQCGRERFYARLDFVDTPETNLSFPERVRQQYEYFGVTLDELTRAGAQARDLVQVLLRERQFVIHTKKSFAQGRSKATRYYALVQVDGRYLHEILLSEGLARNRGTIVALPSGEKARAHAQRLQHLEDGARSGLKGLWSNHVPSRRILKSPF